MDFGIAETGIARGSLPGTTTEVLRFGIPFAEIRVVSEVVLWIGEVSWPCGLICGSTSPRGLVWMGLTEST
jgi:hypothetical protein